MDGEPAAAVVSVWMVNYNSTQWLARALTGLTSDRIRSIVVLDNASAPEQRAALLALAADRPELRVLLSEVNLGFGAGHNHIARVTRPDAVPGELLWLLNPDTVVESAAVQALCAVVEQNQADLVSPVILTGEPGRPVVWFAGGSIDRRRARVAPALVGQAPGSVPAAPLLSGSFLSGAALLMPRTTFERLGGFRGELFLYWEDVDLCLRAAAVGLRLRVVTNAVIWHAEGGSSRRAGKRSAGKRSAGNRSAGKRSAGNRSAGNRSAGNVVGSAPGGAGDPTDVAGGSGDGGKPGGGDRPTSRFESATGTSATAFYYSARNRILVCAPPGSRLGLVIGRGTPYFLRLAATALLAGGPQRWTKWRAVLRGSLDGVRGRTGDAHR